MSTIRQMELFEVHDAVSYPSPSEKEMTKILALLSELISFIDFHPYLEVIIILTVH